MATKLYGHIVSTCTQRVLFLLDELKLDYELVPINMMKGEHCQPEFVEERHPFARIPAYEDSDLKLYESRAICRFLVTKHSGSLSLPTKPSDLGKFEQAASVEYSYFDPAVFQLAYEKMFKGFMGHGEPDPALVKKYEAAIRQCLDVYEGILSKSDYLTGENFTLVDLFHAPWVNFLPRLGFEQELKSRPHVAAWWTRVSDRPSWKSVCGKMDH